MSKIVETGVAPSGLQYRKLADGTTQFYSYDRTHKCPLCGRVIWRMIGYHLNRYHKDEIWDHTNQETLRASVDRAIEARRRWEEDRAWRWL